MNSDGVSVRFTREMVEMMGDGWSSPVQVKLTRGADGEYALQARRLVTEAPAPLSGAEAARIRAEWEHLSPCDHRPNIIV